MIDISGLMYFIPLPAAFVGILAVWAALSRRHWFLRTGVVMAAVAVPLVIPAYEIVIDAAIESLLVVAGVAIWRYGSRSRPSGERGFRRLLKVRPQLSLRDALLLMSVVAVGCVVAVKLYAFGKDFSGYYWSMLAGEGVIAACTALAGAGLVMGRRHWMIRVIVAVLLPIAVPWIEFGRDGYFEWLNYGGQTTFWQGRMFDDPAFWEMTRWRSEMIAVCMLIVSAMVFLLVQAGWVNSTSGVRSKEAPLRSADDARVRRRIVIARSFFLAIAIPAGIFFAYVLFELCRPTPYPADLAAPSPGYLEIIAAGEMRADDGSEWPAEPFLYSLTNDELRQQFEKMRPVLDRVRAALAGDCRFPFTDPFSDFEARHSEMVAISRLWNEIGGFTNPHRGMVLSPDEYLTMCFDCLALAEFENRGNGANTVTSGYFALSNGNSIDRFAMGSADLDATQCKAWAVRLMKLDNACEPFERRVERQRIITENSSWGSHLGLMIDNWLGKDVYADKRREYWSDRAKLRLLAADLAIRTFEQETGQLPAKLAELVPHYLPAVPADPFGQGPLKYRVRGRKYAIYSVGDDGEDNGGRESTGLVNESSHDLSFHELFWTRPGHWEWLDADADTDDDVLPANGAGKSSK